LEAVDPGEPVCRAVAAGGRASAPAQQRRFSGTAGIDALHGGLRLKRLAATASAGQIPSSRSRAVLQRSLQRVRA
jgi:hypothetical protein